MPEDEVEMQAARMELKEQIEKYASRYEEDDADPDVGREHLIVMAVLCKTSGRSSSDDMFDWITANFKFYRIEAL